MTTTYQTVTLTWTHATPEAPHAFEAVENGDIYRAYRHRTDYGWSWYSITVNGEPSTINSGRQTELPRTVSFWR